MLSNNFDIISNQAVNFTGLDVNCSNEQDIEYQNIVNADDITQVQFKLYPDANVGQLLYNSEFNSVSGWNLGFWNIDDGVLYLSTGGVYGPYTAYVQPNNLYMPFGKNALMKVVIGIMTNTHGFELRVGVNTFSIPAGLVGEYEFYGGFGIDTGVDDIISVTSYDYENTGPYYVNIDYIRAYPINYDYIFLVRNLQDNTVSATYSLYQYIIGNTFTGSEPFRLIDNNLTWTINWSDLELPNGCYRLEVCDPYINTNLQNSLPNQDFNYFNEQDLDYVSGDVLVTFNGDSTVTISHVSGAFGAFAILTDTAPVSGLTYNYQVNYNVVTLGTGSISLALGFGGDSDSYIITGGSSKTGDLTSDGGIFSFQFILTGNASIKVSLARLFLQNDNDLTGNYISNTFKIVDSECNSVVLHGCSDIDYTFGLNFASSSFDLRGRVLGKLVNSNYELKRSSYMHGEKNNQRGAYFMRKKVKTLKLDLLHEYMLDFVSAWIGLDHIYIDNVEYMPNGDEFFQLVYDNNLDNAGYVTISLLEKDSTIESKACVSLGVGCSDDVNCVLDPDDDTCLIDPMTNDPVISLE